VSVIPLTVSFSFPVGQFTSTIKISFYKTVKIRFIRWPNPISDTIALYGDEFNQFFNFSSNAINVFSKSASVARANNFFAYTPAFPSTADPNPRFNNYKDFTEYLTPCYQTRNIYLTAVGVGVTSGSITIGYEKK